MQDKSSFQTAHNLIRQRDVVWTHQREQLSQNAPALILNRNIQISQESFWSIIVLALWRLTTNSQYRSLSPAYVLRLTQWCLSLSLVMMSDTELETPSIHCKLTHCKDDLWDGRLPMAAKWTLQKKSFLPVVCGTILVKSTGYLTAISSDTCEHGASCLCVTRTSTAGRSCCERCIHRAFHRWLMEAELYCTYLTFE